jgi:hypothetical protein
VATPSILVGVDPLGRAVLDRVARSLSEDEPSVRYLRGPIDALEAQLVKALDELLQAGRVAGDDRQVRLDLFVFCEVNALPEGGLVALCQRLVGVVNGRYAVMFPPDLPPGQRNAALHLVAVVPALGGQPEAQQAIARLADLDRWSRQAPTLARVWLLSRHTIAGTLSEDGLIASCAAFAVAGVELRQAPQVSQRLAHLDEDGRFGLLSVASLEVPEAGLRRYARERAAHDGFVSLVGRVTRQVSDPTLADQAVAAAEQHLWFAPFDEGEVAQRVRRLSADLSGAAPALPAELPVGPFDGAPEVRERYGVLFRPATQERALSGVDTTELDETLRALGRVEADAMAAVTRGMGTLLTSTLGPQSGLRRVPEVELGLRRLGAWLRDADGADRMALEGALGGTAANRGEQPKESDPHREELEQSLAELPSPGLLRGASAAVGLGVGAAVLMVLLRVVSPAASASTAKPTPAASVAPGTVTTGPTARRASGAQAPSGGEMVPWAAAALVGGLAAVGWARFAGNQARDRLRRLLKQRRDALEQLWGAGGGGRPRAQAEAQLQLRKRRVRKAAVAAVDQTLLKMGAVNAVLLDQRDRAAQSLRDLGIKSLAWSAAQDDLTGLLGERDALHDTLVPPALLSAWVARRRQITDADLWADRLVEQTWPARGGLDDVPCADAARIEELCRWQIAPFVEQSMLGDPEIAQAAASSVEQFIRRAAAALAPPVIPRTDLGDPAPGLRPGETFAVAPQQGAADIEAALQRSPFPMPVLWSPTRAARVLFLRTWEGHTLADLARGARVVLPGGER